MEKNKTRVLVAEDTEIGRRGIRDMFETAEDIVLAGETDSVHSVPRLVQELAPDVLLLDLKWFDDEAAGWIKIRELKQSHPELKIVAITAFPELGLEAWKQGADQVVSKNLRREELLEVLRTVNLRKAAPEREESLGNQRPAQLSPRELQVLELLDKGLSDKEISEALSIEVHTTKNHVKSILQKLNVENRRKAAIKAREQGILS